jgi:dipeptidase E
MSTAKSIIAFGDGGTDSKNPLMDLYIIANARKKNPKVCFLGTASGDNEAYIGYFEKLFGRYPCKPTHLSLFRPHTSDIEDFILSTDVIYVGGGHTKAMLGCWREYGLDKILKKAYDNGTVLSGGSAGSVCWFDQCITDSIPGRLSVMNCLGILPYSNCPHFSSVERRASYAEHITDQSIKDGYAADDFAALHFVNGELIRSVSTTHYAKTFKLSHNNGKCKRQQLPTKWLDVHQNELIWDLLQEDAA